MQPNIRRIVMGNTVAGLLAGGIPGFDFFGLSLRRKLGLAGRSKYKPHQDEQEKARRVRQLARGIIK